MADAAVTFLLDNVSRLLKSYVDLIVGAEEQLQELEQELDSLKASLEDAAKMPKDEETFRKTVSHIREVIYDVEDAIDTCLTEAATAKFKGKWLQWLNGPKRLSMAKKVESLRGQKVKPMLIKAKQELANTSAAQGSVEQKWMRANTVPLVRSDKVVGFKKDEEILIKYLKEVKEELDVISIVGLPGLGKTTLAWKIYQNRELAFEIPNRIWIYVSQEFNQRDVFLNIVKKFTSEDMSKLNEQDLIIRVREYLKDERFLLILDDVWTDVDWKVIEQVLPQSNKLGKVLITSREKNVAKHANVAREPYELDFLSDEESWELLQLEVFGKCDICPPELRDRGETIAKECGGLPLAIVVIGGILVEKYSRPVNSATIDAWQDISENVTEHFKNKAKKILDIVELSYKNLPNELRDCFLYLAVFPEDHEIPAWTLTRLWIAEGFIQRKEGKSLEETAEENLTDLINRNLVMVDRTNPDGQVKACRVHDVIHLFCHSKAEEQNFFREIKMSRHGIFDPLVSEIGKYRRLCVHSYISKFLSERPQGKGMRSFLCFNKDPKYRLEAKHNSVIFAAFNLLRVLDSRSIIFTQFPKKITQLIHLRYITLRCDDLDSLPEEVSGLWNLQTLVVETNANNLKLNANIWKMIQLRHLKTKASIVLAFKDGGTEANVNLQTLSRLSPECCTEHVFKRAPNLKRLGIRGKLATSWDGRSLQKLHLLENLKLVNDLIYGSAYENPLHRLPEPNCFPEKLKKLSLAATFLDWKHMSTLGKIETLQVLKLKERAFVGTEWKVVGGGFSSLRCLLIGTTDLVHWMVSTGDFPQLKSLVLKGCDKLNKIPLCLGKSLDIVDLESVAKSVIDSAKKIEDNKPELKITIGAGLPIRQ